MSDGLSERLARWSQRKLAARQAQRGETPAAPDDMPAPASAAVPEAAPAEQQHPTAKNVIEDPAEKAEKKDDTACADARPVLPSLDELDANSDYTPFLGKDVPEALTRAALRKLWLSDPALANLDGLNDYDEDFNLIDQAITTAQTNYKVGRGYLDEEPLEPQKDGDVVERVSGGTSQTESEKDEQTSAVATEDEKQTAQAESENTSVRPVATGELQEGEDAAANEGEAPPNKSAVSDG